MSDPALKISTRYRLLLRYFSLTLKMASADPAKKRALSTEFSFAFTFAYLIESSKGNL